MYCFLIVRFKSQDNMSIIFITQKKGNWHFVQHKITVKQPTPAGFDDGKPPFKFSNKIKYNGNI